MASIRYGAGIVDARGSISGQTFSRNANGAYIRARVAGTNPATQEQTQARTRFGTISSAWNSLTKPQADSWIEAAKGTLGAYTDRLGQSSQYTGQQLFNKLNNVRALFGNPPLVSAPVAEPFAQVGLASATVEYDDTTHDFEEMSLLISMGLGETSDLLIYTSGEVSMGVNRPKSANRIFLGAVTGEAAGSLDVLPLWLARGLEDKKKNGGAEDPPPDSRIFFWVVPANEKTGQTDAELVVSTSPVEAAP